MNKEWLSQLAVDIETKYGKKARDKIFGDIDSIKNTSESLSVWFEKLISGMDDVTAISYISWSW